MRNNMFADELPRFTFNGTPTLETWEGGIRYLVNEYWTSGQRQAHPVISARRNELRTLVIRRPEPAPRERDREAVAGGDLLASDDVHVSTCPGDGHATGNV